MKERKAEIAVSVVLLSPSGLGADSEYDIGFLPSDPVADGEPGAAGGIPQFWLTTLRNHTGLAELITERDEKALEYLTNVTLHHLDPNDPNGEKKMGFKLVFEFEENPFFEGKELVKTYYYLVRPASLVRLPNLLIFDLPLPFPPLCPMSLFLTVVFSCYRKSLATKATSSSPTQRVLRSNGSQIMI